jgi:hypothetical protein
VLPHAVDVIDLGGRRTADLTNAFIALHDLPSELAPGVASVVAPSSIAHGIAPSGVARGDVIA